MNKILQFYSLINKHFIAGRVPIVRVFPITDMAPKVHPKFSMNPQAPIKPEKKLFNGKASQQKLSESAVEEQNLKRINKNPLNPAWFGEGY